MVKVKTSSKFLIGIKGLHQNNNNNNNKNIVCLAPMRTWLYFYDTMQAGPRL